MNIDSYLRLLFREASGQEWAPFRKLNHGATLLFFRNKKTKRVVYVDPSDTKVTFIDYNLLICKCDLECHEESVTKLRWFLCNSEVRKGRGRA